MAKKIFIFDYDGVIADSLDMCIEAFNILKDKYGLPGELTKEAIAKLPHVNAEAAFGLLGVSPEDKHLYTDELIKMLQSNAIKAKIFDGIGDVFRIVKESGAYLAINTANGSGTVKKRLQMSGLAELPDYIVGADTPGAKAEKIRHIIEKFSGTPDDTYMIGDSMGDITEGRKAGAHTVAVCYGWQPREILESVDPEYICDSMDDLKVLVQKKSRV
ncbi:MAG: HAD family hydrolase [Spirochaetia bacterium]|nr:HAD family hydrolase [Spirochaetia bacterium]